MRARLIIALFVCLSTGLGRAHAEEIAASAGATTSNEPSPASEDDVAAAADAPYPPLDAEPSTHEAARAPRRSFVHPTLDGLTGGAHVVDASSGAPGTFRVAVQGRYFRKDGFLAAHDDHRHGGVALALSLTPIEHLELAAHLSAYSTQNRTTDPEVIQVIGDAQLFAKGFARVAPWLTLAGDGELALLNGVGSMGIKGAATSFGLRASATADLRATARPVPLLLRANVRYLFDNSGKLARDIESARYGSLANAAPRDAEFRHLLSAGERYALQVNRVDRVGASLGVELPLRVGERLLLSPLVEWELAVPVNRQDFDCVETRVPGQREHCLNERGFSAWPSTLTVGLRTQPYVTGLALLLAIDVATSGHRELVRELSPTSRYMVQMGLSYAYDPRPRPTPPARIERVEIPAPAPLRGHVVGLVVESGTARPLAGAVVHFEGTSLSDVLTDAQGAFRSAELSPGAQGLRIRADGFDEALCVAVVPTSGADVEARCELAPVGDVGALRGRVTDLESRALESARVTLAGPVELSFTTGSDGQFAQARVPAGDYALEATAIGYFPGRAQVHVETGKEAAPSLALIARPPVARVALAPKRLITRRAIQFAPDSAVLTAETLPLLAEAAELLSAHPEVAHVEVQAHVDPMGDEEHAQELSVERAEAVRDFLVQAGVAPARLSAVGYGSSRPLVPNITLQNRVRNRRIHLLVKSPPAAQ